MGAASSSSSRNGDGSLQHNLVPQDRKLADGYDVERLLGSGRATNVHRGRSRTYTKSRSSGGGGGVAVKLYDGSTGSTPPDLLAEAAILRKLDHPHIVKLFEVARISSSSPRRVSLVLELCEGGPLLDRAPFGGGPRTRRVVRQICSAVSYLHRHNIVHRDVECGNVLFATPADDSDVKLVDFGSAVELEVAPGRSGAYKPLTEKTGSLYVMAPEVLKGRYGPKADVWSVGVVAYTMLNNGTRPFNGSTTQELERRILSGTVGLTGSDSAEGFLRRTLEPDVGRRWTAAQTLTHPWLLHDERGPKYNDSELVIDREIAVGLDLFRLAPPLKRIALNVLARSSRESSPRLTALWDEYLDVTNSGTLTETEFLRVFSGDRSPEEAADIFEKLDLNRNGEITFTEFSAATLENSDKGGLEEARVREAFRLLSGDGRRITKRDLKRKVGASKRRSNLAVEDRDYLKEEFVAKIFAETNEIKYEEFARMFEHGYAHQIGTPTILETSLNEEQLRRLTESNEVRE